MTTELIAKNKVFFFIILQAAQWTVRLTSVLNRKNGFAEDKIGAKVAVAQSHKK